MEEIREVTIKELLNIFESNSYNIEIDSKDGFIEVLNVFKSGFKECLSINNGILECSLYQLIETNKGWVKACDLKCGDYILTKGGLCEVFKLDRIGKHLTYDLSVNNIKHRYYGNNISLHNCYGGTAYTVAGNMKVCKEEAQVKINNFFSRLSTLNLYMLLAKKKVLETGQVYNLFGRRSDMSKWAFSKNWKDKAYAQRVALNYPIQSSSAEKLKIMMVRVDEYIELNGLSPLYGLDIPQKLDLNKISYKNMVLHELMSTHDEIDFLFHQEHIEQLLPIIYEIMQIKDVMEAFDIGFDLELDCEYDKKNRSLIASNSYLNSKIYIVNQLKKNKMVGENKIIPNAIVIDFDTIVSDQGSSLLDKLIKYSSGGEEVEYTLIISSNNGFYIHKNKFSLDIINSLGIKYDLAYLN